MPFIAFLSPSGSALPKPVPAHVDELHGAGEPCQTLCISLRNSWDEAEIRLLLTDVLTNEGYIVDHAKNGSTALAYLHTAPALPCVIILDLMMPSLNGWDFLRARQGDPVLEPIPIVVISTAHTFATAKVLGAQDFLLKPLDLNHLVALIRQYCDCAPSQR